MNLTAILDTIEELEKQEATPESVQELSALYIVRDHNPAYSQANNSILPTYNNYCTDRRKCQLGQLAKENVVEDLRFVCSEILILIQNLYSGTTCEQERDQIRLIIQELATKYL